MAVLDKTIHVFFCAKKGVDARIKSAHDGDLWTRFDETGMVICAANRNPSPVNNRQNTGAR
jgi:hypothetical protein